MLPAEIVMLVVITTSALSHSAKAACERGGVAAHEMEMVPEKRAAMIEKTSARMIREQTDRMYLASIGYLP
jgi:hypothetical protein